MQRIQLSMMALAAQAACGDVATGTPDGARAADARADAFSVVDADPGAPDAASSAYRTAVLADGPMMYWRLGDSGAVARDETADHRDGQVTGGALVGGALAGDPDGAHAFAGPTVFDHVIWGPADAYAGEFTVEAWVRVDADGAFADILCTRTPHAEFGFDLSVLRDAEGVGLRFDVGDGTQWLETGRTPYDPTLGVWHHVAVVIGLDAAGAVDGQIFIDGLARAVTASFGEATTPPVLYDLDRYVQLGADERFGSYLEGALDEVAVYPHRLTAARIQAHVAIAAGGTVAP